MLVGKKKELRLSIPNETSKVPATISPFSSARLEIDTPTVEKAAQFIDSLKTPEIQETPKDLPAKSRSPFLRYRQGKKKAMDYTSDYPDMDMHYMDDQSAQGPTSSLQTPVISGDTPMQPFAPPSTFPVDEEYQSIFQMEVYAPAASQEPISQQPRPLAYAPPPAYESSQNATSHLPLTVEELSSSQYNVAHSPSNSSTGSSQHSRSEYSSSPENRRKQSTFSEDGRSTFSSSRRKLTKKQQLDALCERKRTLEAQNQGLRDEVSGYERACKKLKSMLYERIRQHRA